MKKNIMDLIKLFILINLLILALMSMPEHAPAEESSIVWIYTGTSGLSGWSEK